MWNRDFLRDAVIPFLRARIFDTLRHIYLIVPTHKGGIEGLPLWGNLYKSSERDSINPCGRNGIAPALAWGRAVGSQG